MIKTWFILASLLFSVSGYSIPNPKVFLIVIDGVRDLEVSGQSHDDYGKPVSEESLFPFLSTLKKRGAFFSQLRISNPSGVSFPAYADIFTGSRQSKILNNDSPSENISGPTIFEAFRKNPKTKTSDILFLSSWEKLCEISARGLKSDEIFPQSCGHNKKSCSKGKVFEEARADSDTFIEATKLIRENHPLLTFIQFNDADEEAHLQKDVRKRMGVEYGIHHYHQALQNIDYYIRRLWEQIQQDSFYKDSTYLFVTTDHGRDDSGGEKEFADHGHCFFCSGYKRVFGIFIGPEIPVLISKQEYQHTDLAPTIAKILDTEFSTASGVPISELFLKPRQTLLDRSKEN